MDKYALVVAGGSGTRMKSTVPKQFLEVAGQPILMHTLQRFQEALPDIQIILVLAEEMHAEWNQLREQYQFETPYRLCAGGATRTQSVRNGLNLIPSKGSLVAIHDGVRPCVSQEIILNSFRVAQEKGSAITSVRLKDSIRELDSSKSISRNRDQYRLIQTPQTFRSDIIQPAYAKLKEGDNLSDDASVAEKFGHRVHLIEGDYRNIKATTPEDLAILKVFLAEPTKDLSR